MGIPGFASRVKKHAVRKPMIGNQSPTIIDGPGLAHLIYDCCLIPDKMRDEAISRRTYAQLGRATLRWLGDLEAHGYVVKVIYFDGALPSYKSEERVERATDIVRNIRNRRERSDLDAKHNAGYNLDNDELDLVRINPEIHLNRITPPLLYAAIFEALQASDKYKDITIMVPGEADPYCALAATEVGNATILTMDSDLLLYDVGPTTEVLQLHTIACPMFSGSIIPSALVINPTHLKHRFGLSSLIGPAFLIKISEKPNDYQSLAQAVQAWKDRVGDLWERSDYQELLQRYSLSAYNVQLMADEHYEMLVHDLRLIDVRVSEFVCQVYGICGMPAPHGFCDMYPAVVLDDICRAPAWAVCRPLRNIAYSIVLHANTAVTIVREWIRRGIDVAPHELELEKDESQLVRLVRSWTQAIDQRIKGYDDLCNADAWRFAAMELLIWDLGEEGKHIPKRAAVVAVLKSHTPSNWYTIHFDAQYQVALYSLRMMKQLVDVTMEWSSPKSPTLCSSVKELQGVMSKMPRTAALFDGDLGGPKRPPWEQLVGPLVEEAERKRAERVRAERDQEEGDRVERDRAEREQAEMEQIAKARRMWESY